MGWHVATTRLVSIRTVEVAGIGGGCRIGLRRLELVSRDGMAGCVETERCNGFGMSNRFGACWLRRGGSVEKVRNGEASHRLGTSNWHGEVCRIGWLCLARSVTTVSHRTDSASRKNAGPACHVAKLRRKSHAPNCIHPGKLIGSTERATDTNYGSIRSTCLRGSNCITIGSTNRAKSFYSFGFTLANRMTSILPIPCERSAPRPFSWANVNILMSSSSPT